MHKNSIVIGGTILTILIVSLAIYIDRRDVHGSGTIEVLGAPSGTTIFLDNKREMRVSGPTSPAILRNLSIGTHTIVVAKDGHWPWSKELLLANNEHVAVRAFVLPQEPKTEILLKSDTRYETVSTALRSQPLPNEWTPLESYDNLVHIWTSANAIYARWVGEGTPPDPFCVIGECKSDLTVLPADKKIRDLAYLPERNDVVIFSAENGIFALELDKRGTQNFQPIYLGLSPRFVFVEQNLLAIEDQNKIILLHL